VRHYPLRLTRESMEKGIHDYLAWNKDKTRGVELAFYGGNFTGIDIDYQEQLLSWAQFYVRQGSVHSIRISTRPDYIDQNKTNLLRKYGVKTVEIGAQSFVAEVLKKAQRGHSVSDTEEAVMILKQEGFKIGLHLMIGLPADTEEGFVYSIAKTVQMRPDTVRIHPVLVLRGTNLAELFLQGSYRPLELSTAIALCQTAWIQLAEAGIAVIRMGLHGTSEMAEEGNVLAGPVHPALGSLVMSSVFFDYTSRFLKRISVQAKQLQFILSEQDVSNFSGHHKMNLMAIQRLYPSAKIMIKSSRNQKQGEILLSVDSQDVYRFKIPQTH